MQEKEIYEEQLTTALKAYQADDVEGAYQLICMYEDHATASQIAQKAYAIRPGQWKRAMVGWLNVAAQQMRVQLGLDTEGVLIKPLASVALKTALSLIEDSDG